MTNHRSAVGGPVRYRERDWLRDATLTRERASETGSGASAGDVRAYVCMYVWMRVRIGEGPLRGVALVFA